MCKSIHEQAQDIYNYISDTIDGIISATVTETSIAEARVSGLFLLMDLSHGRLLCVCANGHVIQFALVSGLALLSCG